MRRLILAVLCISTAASAEDLKPFQKVAQDDFTQRIAEYIDHVKAKCGVTIAVKLDFHDFTPELRKTWDGNAIYSFCGGILEGMSHMCANTVSGSAYGKALAKQTREVVCL